MQGLSVNKHIAKLRLEGRTMSASPAIADTLAWLLEANCTIEEVHLKI
jgi:hypothetical protein